MKLLDVNGKLKNTPLSNEPSPNCSELTFVLVAKTPKLAPFLYCLLSSTVKPLSPARYVPYDTFASNGIRLKFLVKV